MDGLLLEGEGEEMESPNNPIPTHRLLIYQTLKALRGQLDPDRSHGAAVQRTAFPGFSANKKWSKAYGS